MPSYRPNVALILARPSGEVLICERGDAPGSWQFPQGGIEPGESPEVALEREMREEIGLLPGFYRVTGRRGPYRYLFADGYKKGGFDGQEQHYFLASLVGGGDPVRVGGESKEFIGHRWIEPHEFQLAWVARMKREVYRQVLADFFGVAVS